MRDMELMGLRRQILDWRDKWLTQVPATLEKDLPELIALLNVQIDHISFKETFRTKDFAEKHLQPTYKRWVSRESEQIMRLAEKDLESINQNILEYKASVNEWVAADTSFKNVTQLGLATTTTGVALLGIPAVATLSAQSAGFGLGLLGVTVVSWPIAIGGAAVIGTMAVFGGSRLSTFKDKAIRELKDSVGETIKSTVLGASPEKPSVRTALQHHIRSAATAYLEELHRV
ncbi:hypothetical protein [Marinobacter arenosus]|uniref:hypothetical protein n=1 Tax=Marinobacter arenosus TaxID=2856822 RepID=UPI001C4B2BF8|nr:hypothetical protein [Marinobacter arenosus]MBW0147226.1 hypothetical protein [Marinobacter arenosus]